jgi:outer membrane protein
VLPLAARAQLPRLPDMGGAAARATGAGLADTQRRLQVPLPTHPLTLMELTDLALQNNPSTRLAWARVRAAAAQLGIAGSAYWPQVDGTLSVTRSRRQSLSNAGSTGPSQTYYGPGVSLSYLLWDFGTRAGDRDAARYRLLGSRLTRNQTLQDVILTVEQDYYQLQGYEALLAANRKSLENALTSLKAAEKRRELGLSTVGDVYRAQAAVAQERLVLEQTRANEAAARGRLAGAAGYPVDTPLAIVPWSDAQRPPPPAVGVGRLLAMARRARPALLAAKAQELAALANIRAVRGAGLPTVTLDANAARTRVSSGGGSSSYQLTGTLRVPLFTGFADRYARQQAAAEAEQAQADTGVLRVQVEQEVWQSYQDVQAGTEKLASSAALLKSATLAAKVAEARYAKGLDSILDLLTAQATLSNARASRVQTELDYYSALSALGHAVGGLSDAAEVKP